MQELKLALFDENRPCSCAAAPHPCMIRTGFRGKTYFIWAIATLSTMILMHQHDFSSTVHLTAKFGGSSMHVKRWMESCGFELYPNLKWTTVKSQHALGQSAMTVFLPFAVQNNWVYWDSPEVDDSDFRHCPTSCVWIRSRENSLEGLRRGARCAAQAHAVLFWLPLGHPSERGADSLKDIKDSGLFQSGNQLWVAVATEPNIIKDLSFLCKCPSFSAFAVYP
jgi:hypothetical protein